MIITPLEALIVKPGEVLVFRLPKDATADEHADLTKQIAAWAKDAGLDNRVVVVDGAIDLAKIEA